MNSLLYVGQQVADELKDSIHLNLERYVAGDFADLESKGDWRIRLSIQADLDQLRQLSHESGQAAEISNAHLVGQALSSLTPALARENRIWVRLSHVECLEYSRARWIAGETKEDALIKSIRKHFFASTLTGCRDDHSIARLWWAHRIAKQAMPDDPARALRLILARADIRLSLVERPGIGARSRLCAAVLRLLDSDTRLLESESEFRLLMRRLNLVGAGIAFEVWSAASIDAFLVRLLESGRQSAPRQPAAQTG